MFLCFRYTYTKIDGFSDPFQYFLPAIWIVFFVKPGQIQINIQVIFQAKMPKCQAMLK